MSSFKLTNVQSLPRVLFSFICRNSCKRLATISEGRSHRNLPSLYGTVAFIKLLELSHHRLENHPRMKFSCLYEQTSKFNIALSSSSWVGNHTVM